VAVAFAAQLALAIYNLKGPLFGAVKPLNCEALGRLPTPPKAKAGTD